MKKLLLIFLLIPCFAKAQDSIPDDLLKWKFILSVNSMWYWYETTSDMRKVDSVQKEVIKLYQDLTGVQAGSLADIKKAYEMKNVILSECPKSLELAIEDVAKEERRKKRWRSVAVVGIPIGIGVGGIGTLILLAR